MITISVPFVVVLVAVEFKTMICTDSPSTIAFKTPLTPDTEGLNVVEELSNKSSDGGLNVPDTLDENTTVRLGTPSRFKA